jgi:hypothetical protein
MSRITEYAACIYGLGGPMWDPPGGMAKLESDIGVMGISVAAQPWTEENIQAVADFIKALGPLAFLAVGGDSCGANKSPWVAAAIGQSRIIDFMFCIQASEYCNAGCPPIGYNVAEVVCFYADFAETGGLGTFRPPLAAPPAVEAGGSLYDGKRRIGNNGHTAIRYVYRPAPHPDDQDPVVQNIIKNYIRNIRNAKRGAA